MPERVLLEEAAKGALAAGLAGVLVYFGYHIGYHKQEMDRARGVDTLKASVALTAVGVLGYALGRRDEREAEEGNTACADESNSQWIVPFHRPFIAGRERDYVSEAVSSGARSQNEHAEWCQSWLGEQTGKEALLTPSCSAALEMAAILCEIGIGDEVIVPSFTFTTSASAFALFGAKIVFVDIDRESLNISPTAIEEAITSKTR